MNRSGTNSYYHYDGLGSTRQLTNGSEAVAASYTYDGYGNLIASSGSVNNTYGFTGEQQFGEADSMVFLRARYYKPNIGRFISRDPIGYEGGINLYAYVGNNPVNGIDPLGLAGCGPGKIGDWFFPDYPFESCCAAHDTCYEGKGSGGCGASKKDCDDNFCKCMGNVCKKAKYLTLPCMLKATAYCWAVRNLGDSAFNNARKGNCPCAS